MWINDIKKISLCILYFPLMLFVSIAYTQEKQNVESMPIQEKYHSEYFNLKQLISIPKNYSASDFHCFAFSSNAKYVVCGNSDNGLLLINLDNLNTKTYEFNQETLQAVEFFPRNPSFLACGTNKSLHILKVPELEIEYTLNECSKDGGIAWIFLHPSKSIFGISPSNPMAKTTKKYEWHFSESENLDQIKSFIFIDKKDTEILYKIFSISPNAQLLGQTMGFGKSYGLVLYKLEGKTFPDTKPLTQYKSLMGKNESNGLLFVAGFSPDASLCVGGGNPHNNIITIWDIESESVVDELPVPKRKGGDSMLSFVQELIYGLEFSKDGVHMAATWLNYVGIWEKKDMSQ